MSDPCIPQHPVPPGEASTAPAAIADARAGGDALNARAVPVAGGPSLTLPIITESIQVEKVEVDRGGYRITKRVDSREVLVDEPLLHETVEIERRPVNRELAEGEVPAVRYEGDTMIVPVVKEVVVTQKRLVLVEELRIVRVAGTHRDPQSVTVREEHIEIERLGAETSVIRSS